MQQKLKQKWMPYIKWSVTALVFVIFAVILREPFSKDGAKAIVGELSNCFFIPGALMSAFGALTYLSSKGAYDSFSYIFTNFALHSLIYRDQPKKYESFYDYKMKKDENGRKWLNHMFIVGLFTLALSVILYIVYAIIK